MAYYKCFLWFIDSVLLWYVGILKQWWKASWQGRVCLRLQVIVQYILTIYIDRSQGVIQVTNLEAGIEAEPWRNTAYCPSPPCLFSYISYTVLIPCTVPLPPTVGWVLLIKIMSHRHGTTKAISQFRFPLPRWLQFLSHWQKLTRRDEGYIFVMFIHFVLNGVIKC